MIRFYLTDDITDLPAPLLETNNHEYLENNTIKGNRVLLKDNGNWVGRGIYKVHEILPVADTGAATEDVVVLIREIAISMTGDGGSSGISSDMGPGYGSGYVSGLASGQGGSGEFGSSFYTLRSTPNNSLRISNLVNSGGGSWTADIQLSNLVLEGITGNIDIREIPVSITRSALPNSYVMVTETDHSLLDPDEFATTGFQITYVFSGDPTEGVHLVSIQPEPSNGIWIVEIP